MRHKFAYKILCVIIIVSTITAAEMPLVVRAASLSNELIEQSETAKAQAEQNRQTLKSGLSNIKAMLDDLELAKTNLQDYIVQLDEDLETINSNIEYLEGLIGQKEAQIAVTQKELEEAQQTEEAQYEAMKLRVKFMYEKGTSSYLEMLLTSGGLTEFLNKAEYINRLSSFDRKMLDEYIATKNEIAGKNEELLAEQQELVSTQSDLENEKGAMETLIASKEEEINTYENDINNKEAAIAAYEAEINEQTAIIKELEATILAEKKRLLEQNKKAIVYDGGQFAWPAPSYKRVSDDFGWRTHPILGVKQFHNGVDLAAPSGSPILAAYDGEVVKASYSSTMGNYIMIDHGDGLYTIYMHASSIGVSEGATVVRGEQIGCVGSTGRSTGPHLHFTVRLNGEYVSPWNYLG